jgi:hypothetical protein
VTEKAVPPGDPRLVPALNNLGAVWLQQGQAPAVEPLFRRSMAIVEQALGPDHVQTVLPLGGLAVLYSAEGRYRDAEPLYHRTLAIQERATGPDHPALAGTLTTSASSHTNCTNGP